MGGFSPLSVSGKGDIRGTDFKEAPGLAWRSSMRKEPTHQFRSNNAEQLLTESVHKNMTALFTVEEEK